MQKSRYWFIGLVILLLAAVTACATPAPEKEAPPSQPAPETGPFVFKVASWIPSQHAATILERQRILAIEDKTGGRIKLELYPGEQLAKSTDQYDAVIAGLADIATGTMAGYYPGRFPITQIIELPFLITTGNIETANIIIKEAFDNCKAVQQEWGETKVFCLTYTSRYTMGTVKKKVTQLEDVKGLKLKSMSGPANQSQKALGATPVEVPAAEMYQALQTGMIDGVFYAFASWPSFHLEEACKYCVFPGMYATVSAAYAMNLKAWKSLPPDLQNALVEEYGNAGITMGKVYDVVDKTTLSKLQAAGVAITELSPQELERWKKATEPVHEAYINSLGDKAAGAREFYNTILEARKKHLGY